VAREHYATSFGTQWQKYRQTQLDSFTGRPYSRQRLERCLGGTLDAVKGKIVLECGSGAGRFTELLLDTCRALVSIDLSNAVEANLENCRAKGPYLLCQADINASPLPERFFDVVICLGVIQHTPSPEETIANLARHVKPGGRLILDHYTLRSRLGSISRILTLRFPLRAILRRIARRRPDLAMKATMAVTALCDPIRRRTCQFRPVDRIAARLFPSACYYRGFPLLPPEIIYAWNELDTHDSLTDWFKHYRSRSEIDASLRKLGFTEIECWYGGNGVEARALYPLQVER
jgi:SAM-dependent methyltransferase